MVCGVRMRGRQGRFQRLLPRKFPKFMIWNCDQAYIVAIFQYDIVVKVLQAFLAGSSLWIVSGEGYS